MPNAKPVRTRTPVSFGLQNIVLLTAISALLLISSRARAADLAAPNTGTMTGAGLALATKATDPGQYAFITERLTEWKVVLGGGAMIAPKFEGSDEFEGVAGAVRVGDLRRTSEGRSERPLGESLRH